MAASPRYGTCLSCMQAVSLDSHDRYGCLRSHRMTATTADGSVRYTLQCPGSGGPSAQSLGVIYDMSPHRRCWVCATCSAATGCGCPRSAVPA